MLSLFGIPLDGPALPASGCGRTPHGSDLSLRSRFFYDTAVSYYSEQFGDAASAQSQDPPLFARFIRAADTSILNSDVSLDLERILQENVLLEGEGSEDADTADSDAADSESATASP